MVRVGHQKSGKQTATSTGLRGSKAAKLQQRKKHKVVLESTSKDKGQTHNVLAFNADPPAGYTFIPAGNPEFTAALKQQAKKRNLETLAVTTTPHASRHELSREVHRVGFHFPNVVVAEVCKYYGVELMSNGRLREDKDDDAYFRRIYEGDNAPREKSKPDQITINTEAKQIIKDLFPNIPDNDLFQIIKTAFQLGDNKVGTAEEIPLVRRAQLSVVAHIRHTYTNYDKLLRQVPYAEARHRVENDTLKNLIEWRGDNEDTKAMDDVLREVVVISDEEDTADEVEEGQLFEANDLHVQPVKSTMRPTQAHGGRPGSPIEVHSDEEPPRGYRYVPQVVRRAPVRDQPPAAVSRQQSRYALWDQLRQEYRVNRVAPQPPRVIERVLIDDPVTPRSQSHYVIREPVYADEHAPRRIMEPPVSIDNTWKQADLSMHDSSSVVEKELLTPLSQVRVLSQAQPTYIRGDDGKVYERIVAQPEQSYAPLSPRRIYTPPSLEANRQHIQSRPASPRVYPLPPPHRRTESFEGDMNVLPSIEGSNESYMSPRSKRNPYEDIPYTAHTQQPAVEQYDPRQPVISDLTDHADHDLKRRRVELLPSSHFLDRPPQQDHRTWEQGASGRIQYIQESTTRPPRRIVGQGEVDPNSSPRHSQYPTEHRVQQDYLYQENISGNHILTPRGADNTRSMYPSTDRDPRVVQSSHIVNHVDPPVRYRGQENLVRQPDSIHRQALSHDRNRRILYEEIPSASKTGIDTYQSPRSRLDAENQEQSRYSHHEVHNPFALENAPQYRVQRVPQDEIQGRKYAESSAPYPPEQRRKQNGVQQHIQYGENTQLAQQYR